MKGETMRASRFGRNARLMMLLMLGSVTASACSDASSVQSPSAESSTAVAPSYADPVVALADAEPVRTMSSKLDVEAALETDDELVADPVEPEVEVAEPAGSISGPVIFQDPQGYYQLEVDPAWEMDVADARSKVETWLYESDPSDTSGLLIATFPAMGHDLSSYVSQLTGASPGAVVLAQSVVIGSDGQELGFVELTNAGEHIIGYSIITERHISLALLYGNVAEFTSMRHQFEPFMMTLQAPNED